VLFLAAACRSCVISGSWLRSGSSMPVRAWPSTILATYSSTQSAGSCVRTTLRMSWLIHGFTRTHDSVAAPGEQPLAFVVANTVMVSVPITVPVDLPA
jgi:hypothetical protein